MIYILDTRQKMIKFNVTAMQLQGPNELRHTNVHWDDFSDVNILGFPRSGKWLHLVVEVRVQGRRFWVHLEEHMRVISNQNATVLYNNKGYCSTD